eukprot:13963270-Alexandrium_andersonii.AAC.1
MALPVFRSHNLVCTAEDAPVVREVAGEPRDCLLVIAQRPRRTGPQDEHRRPEHPPTRPPSSEVWRAGEQLGLSLIHI